MILINILLFLIIDVKNELKFVLEVYRHGARTKGADPVNKEELTPEG